MTEKKKFDYVKFFNGEKYTLYPGSKHGSRDFSVKSDAKEAVKNLRKKCYFARVIKSPFGWWVYRRPDFDCKSKRSVK